MRATKKLLEMLLQHCEHYGFGDVFSPLGICWHIIRLNQSLQFTKLERYFIEEFVIKKAIVMGYRENKDGFFWSNNDFGNKKRIDFLKLLIKQCDEEQIQITKPFY